MRGKRKTKVTHEDQLATIFHWDNELNTQSHIKYTHFKMLLWQYGSDIIAEKVYRAKKRKTKSVSHFRTFFFHPWKSTEAFRYTLRHTNTIQSFKNIHTTFEYCQNCNRINFNAQIGNFISVSNPRHRFFFS